MTEFQGFLDIFIRLGLYLVGVVGLGYIFYFILKEFGVDILKGKMNLKDYINLGVGLVILAFMLIYSGALIGYASLKGFQKMKPYLVQLQTEIVEDVRSIIVGDNASYTTDFTVEDENTTYNAPAIFPTAPYPVEEQSGGGVPIAPTSTPFPNITVIPNEEPTPTAGWFTKEDLP